MVSKSHIPLRRYNPLGCAFIDNIKQYEIINKIIKNILLFQNKLILFNPSIYNFKYYIRAFLWILKKISLKKK